MASTSPLDRLRAAAEAAGSPLPGPVLIGSATVTATSSASVILVRSLGELLDDPTLAEPPVPVVPRLAWAGHITLFAAREKGGKSTILRAGAAALTTGAAFLDGRVREPGSVLWFSADREPIRHVVDQFQHFGADRDRTRIITVRPPTIEAVYGVILAERPSLTVIDTLLNAVHDRVQDANAAGQWAPVLAELVDVTRESGTAMVLCHHATKTSGKYRDSTAIGAAVDLIIEMSDAGGDPELRRMESRGRFLGETWAARITYTDGPAVRLDDGLPSLDAQILTLVQRTPGLPTSSIRVQVKAREEDVQTSVLRLARSGAIEDRGKSRRHSWYPAGAAVLPVLPSVSEEQPQLTLRRSSGPYKGRKNAEEQGDREETVVMCADCGELPANADGFCDRCCRDGV